MSTSIELRNEGMALVLSNTPQAWRELVMSTIAALVVDGREITAEDVREAAGDPPSPNAFGAAIMSACRQKLIVPTGYVPSKRPSSHSRVIRTYRKSPSQSPSQST